MSKHATIVFLAVVNGTLADLSLYDSVWLVLSSHGGWHVYPEDKEPEFQCDVIHGTDAVLPIFLLTEPLTRIDKPQVIVVQVRIINNK
jgi:hypothetical protein